MSSLCPETLTKTAVQEFYLYGAAWLSYGAAWLIYGAAWLSMVRRGSDGAAWLSW